MFYKLPYQTTVDAGYLYHCGKVLYQYSIVTTMFYKLPYQTTVDAGCYQLAELCDAI
jgi:hypothetical protein